MKMAEVTFIVRPNLTVENGHEFAKRVQANIQDALPHVAGVIRSGPGRERADVHGQASLIVSASE